MITNTIENGRLGNQIIRNLSVSLISEKYDLKVNYCNNELINNLGIFLFSGKNIFDNTINLNDDNYFSVYNCGNLTSNLDPNKNFFQTKEITNFLYNYLHKDEIKAKIMDKNPFKHLYNNNNNLYVHIRLTDAAKFNPGIKYYLRTIKNIGFENLYISTDDEKHRIIKVICKMYPNVRILHCGEIKTIQFASTCKNVILSHGSFSAVIGYLSFFSNVSYPEYQSDKMWYGDMFSIDGWVKNAL